MLKCVICQKETIDKPQCPVNWKQYNSGAGYHYTFERDLTLYYEAGKVNLAIAWKCFDVVNGKASTLASSLLQCSIDCRDAFNRIIINGSHDEKKNDFRNPSMLLFVRSLSGLKNDSSCIWCSRKWSLVIRTFTRFSRSVFLNILDPGTGLFQLEGILDVVWDNSL